MNAQIKAVDHLGSPDENAAGLLEGDLDPLRYGGQALDPYEVSGIVTRMIPSGAQVLDVGCGTGSLTELVRDTCKAEVLGIEPDVARANRAVARGLKVRVGYLDLDLIREIGSFDIVLLADVLEHLPNPHAVLLLAREALKPRGAVVVSVPNVAHWSVRLDLLRGNFRYQPSGILDATHLKWFTAASAKAFLASSGFRVIEYRASAGRGLPDNDYRAPLRWLPANYRMKFLHMASKRWPTLFGAQHVLKAVPHP